MPKKTEEEKPFSKGEKVTPLNLTPLIGGFIMLFFAIALAAIVIFAGFDTEKKSSREEKNFPMATTTPSPTPQVDTSNWNTYTNEIYSYQVKYPDTWQEDEESPASGKIFVKKIQSESGRVSLESASITIEAKTLLDTQKEQTLEEYLIEEIGQNLELLSIVKNLPEVIQLQAEQKIESMESFFINGNKGLKDETNAYLKTNDTLFVFQLKYADYLEKFTTPPEKTFDLMISSMSLLTEETLDTTSQFCGGVAGLTCPAGFECILEGNFPDAGGTCVRQ